MSEQSMIERVARAMCGAGGYTDYDAHRQLYDSLAAAAIKAMREATFPMIQAMFNTTDDGSGQLHERKWKAAIDAALVGEG